MALVIVAGCKGGTADPECKAKADALVQTLRTADRSPHYPWGMTLQLTPDGLVGRGAHIELADVARILDAGRAGLSSRAVDPFGGGTGAAAIWVARDVPWSRVVALAEALADAGYIHPIFLVPRAPRSKPPPRAGALGSSVEDSVSTMKKLAEPCPALGKVFGHVASENEDTAELVITGTGKALVECGCNIDMPAFSWAIFDLINDPEPTEPRRVTLAKGGKPLALPAAMPWKEAGGQLSDGASVWLVAN